MATRLKDELLQRSAEIRAIVERNVATRPRLFGSVARGEDGPDSDIDILVDPGPRCSLLDLAEIEIELAEMLGRTVDVRTIRDLHPKLRPMVLDQAIAL